MSLAAMKKQNSLDSLLGAAQKESAPLEKKSYVDERLWKPTMDKTGNGYAVIRFLPAPKGEDLPWVKLWNHAFQGPTGQWFIENSLTTLGNNDPVSEYNSKLWNSGIESDKEIARRQKRKLSYYSNIYVVSDAANPQNEGKVFLYRYGKKIFNKVMEAMQPPFPDTDPINPFDFWEGANFKLKLRKVDGYWNYDLSSFDGVTTLSDDEDKLESVWGEEYSLSEFTAPSNFKTYDELKTRLDMVLSGVTKTGTVETLMENEPTAPAKVNTKPAPAPTVSTDDADDFMSYFEKLAEG